MNQRLFLLELKVTEDNYIFLKFADGLEGYFTLSDLRWEEGSIEDWRDCVLIQDNDKQQIIKSEVDWLTDSADVRYCVDPVYQKEIDDSIKELSKRINGY